MMLSAGLFLSPAAAQPSARDRMSLFDRLAEEATLLNKRGKFDEVISLLQPHKGDPKNDSALFFNELGVAYRNKNKPEEAILAYQKALSLDPDNPVVMKNLGDAFYLKKEYAQAVEICQKALKSNPRFHQARSTLGLAYYRLGKYQEAVEEFEVVLKMNPQDEQARNFRDAARKKLQEKK
jgi:tetratricopeptide (TPR) repeat protein